MSDYVSEGFLADNIFEWLVGTYRKEIKDIELADFVVKKCEESIMVYRIYLPILYLESDKEFKVGRVHFKYLAEDYIKLLSLKVANERRDGYVKSLLIYQGQFMASCLVKAEKEKAKELAIHFITFAVDILRIVSPTVRFPKIRIYYDVDFRNTHQSKNEVLVQPIEDEHNFLQEHSRKAMPFAINQEIWNMMNDLELALFDQFAFKTVKTKTELESLIISAIRNFSKAIANHDQHERITLIFTVLESLLLSDDSAPIVDSVCKYLPKLVSNDFSEREKIIKTVKEMYKVRSSMVHHANRKEFELDDLAIIQKCTRALISKFIKLSTQKTTKKEILKGVDDLINRA